jgi:UDP-2,3-diacylglucosamine pyrophosphatase LpxH
LQPGLNTGTFYSGCKQAGLQEISLRFFVQILLILCQISSVCAAPQFLTLSDIHYGSAISPADGHNTGDEFLTVALNKMNELSKKADFILYLGDIPTHSASFWGAGNKAEYERIIFRRLFEADSELKPMFYITGNNDSLAGNYQPFEVNGKSPLNYATDWAGACVHCEGLIIDDTHMHHDGYYSSYVIPDNKDIMLIALNTVQWTKGPVLLPKYPHQERDALMQLFWLEQQLKKHKTKQLLIAMHVAPGNDYHGASLWHDVYLQKFIKILSQYHSSYEQITLLTSHSHMDEVRKIKLPDGVNVFAYSTPGISRKHHNNPGMKLFLLNDELRIKEFITYYTTAMEEWGNELYHAIGTPDAIFPECQNITLAQCLNTLSVQQVCAYLDEGMFYGVKSPRVAAEECNKVYVVNE